jgi:hypothetical protein
LKKKIRIINHVPSVWVFEKGVAVLKDLPAKADELRQYLTKAS